MKALYTTWLLVLCLVLAACDDNTSFRVEINPPPEPEPEPLGVEVQLDSGRIRGQEHPESAVWEWLAIPFAAPPTGELRWKAPRPVEAWEGTRDALSFGPACPQLNATAEATVIGDEDCLHLNVWRPRSQERGLPVYVWIHGGSNTSGANSWSVYQGDRLAEHSNLVVVSIQYRLGALGWLYFDALHSGDALDDSGNYGTLDIVQSLEWIRNNIEAFGGDPENVTVTGESAGAINIMSLLTSAQADGMFHRAIIQSGIPMSADLERGREAARELAGILGRLADPAAESPDDGAAAELLRAAAVEDIVLNDSAVPAIYRDGTVIPAAGVADTLAAGAFPVKVPVIVGTNKDEYKLWTNVFTYNAYPDVDPAVRAGIGRYVSDLWRVIGADRFATQLSAVDDQPPVYVYRFNWGAPDEQGRSPLPAPFGETLGAHHAMEIPFVLGNWDEWVDPRGTEIFFVESNALGRENLSAAIMEYFAAFAYSGDPNTGNRPAWEAFDLDGDFKALQFDTNLDDSEPKITADTEVWTIESVLADLDATLVEPVRSAVIEALLAFSGTSE